MEARLPAADSAASRRGASRWSRALHGAPAAHAAPSAASADRPRPRATAFARARRHLSGQARAGLRPQRNTTSAREFQAYNAPFFRLVRPVLLGVHITQHGADIIGAIRTATG